MPRPSEAVLTWLREIIKKRGVSTAVLAKDAGLPRAHLRKVLTGAEAMTLDEFHLIAAALTITPAEMGLPGALVETATEEDEEPRLAVAEGEEEEPPFPRVDPFGNQPEQLFRIGFALNCTFLFLADVARLDDAGVPQQVLEQYRSRGQLPIRLDAEYHPYNNPRYDEGGVTLTLSFDALHECRFPWHAIQQVIFWPIRPEPPEEDEDDEEEPPRPVLRLVE